MGFIRDNTNTFQVCLTDLGKQKFFDGGFKDAISFFSISDGDSNYTIFDPALNEIIPFNDMDSINIGDVVGFDLINSNFLLTNDTTFNIGTGFNNSVASIILQPDNKILAGGDFTSYSGVTRNRIIRLNTDGTIDNAFTIGTGFNNSVASITLQPDGKILAGGDFTSYSGVTRNRIIRLNTDGTIDNAFTIGTGFNNSVASITLQPDGKILVGGIFTSYSGVTSNYIVRLNTDGTIDNAFTIGTGFNNSVASITLQPDGKILVGGIFTSYSGVTSNYIIRLNSNGTIDNTFNIGTGFDSYVQSIILQPDGKILVGGNFTSYNGVARNNIIRLNSDGSIDNTFNIGTGFNNFVWPMISQTDGKILVGGNFTLYNGVTRNRIVRLNSDGTIDNAFNIGTGFTGDTLTTMILQPDGKILVGGNFTSYNSTTRNRITRLVFTGDTVLKYFRKLKDFNNYDQLPFNNNILIRNYEFWEEVFPFDSTNINPQPIQILNHNGIRKTSLPLNISNENTYDINRTITITSLTNYNSMLAGNLLVGDSGNNGINRDTIHLKYNEVIPLSNDFKLRKSVIIASEGTKIYGDYKLGIIGDGSKIGVDIYINVIEKQMILADGVFNCVIIKPYYENTWKNEPQTLSPADNHLSYYIDVTGDTFLRINYGTNVRPNYTQQYKAFEVLEDYNGNNPVGDGVINVIDPTGGTTSFNIQITDDQTSILPIINFLKVRSFTIDPPLPPQLNAVSGDTLVVNFDYFIPDFTLVQNSATNTFKIESNIQISKLNDIFTQTTLRGDIVDNKTYRYALFGVKNKTQKSYVLFEPDFNSNDTLSILTYLINE